MFPEVRVEHFPKFLRGSSRAPFTLPFSAIFTFSRSRLSSTKTSVEETFPWRICFPRPPNLGAPILRLRGCGKCTRCSTCLKMVSSGNKRTYSKFVNARVPCRFLPKKDIATFHNWFARYFFGYNETDVDTIFAKKKIKVRGPEGGGGWYRLVWKKVSLSGLEKESWA